jgi:FdhD protein
MMAGPAASGARESPPAGSATTASVLAYGGGALEPREDLLATEEPLEMRVSAEQNGHRVRHSVAVTMRTPGHDLELAAGFFLSEGIVSGRGEIWRIAHCEDTAERNVVDVDLRPGLTFDASRFSRNVYTSSSCGICGKTSIDLVRTACRAIPPDHFRIRADVVVGLADTLRRSQALFSATGGLHAAGLFDAQGQLLRQHEDVGRHNAVDKLVGALLLADLLPWSDGLVLVSGRASFELVQKTLAAGIPALAAVGAPSSLAVDLAREFGLTLIGFLRDRRFNVYSGAERIVP